MSIPLVGSGYKQDIRFQSQCSCQTYFLLIAAGKTACRLPDTSTADIKRLYHMSGMNFGSGSII